MMGSNYLGEGSERGSGSSSSSNSSTSRKGKKNNTDKPNKQPQRGLGVAQLEKIRLHGQLDSPYNLPPYPSNFIQEDPNPTRVQTAAYSSSSSTYSASYGYHPNIVMGLPEYERSNIRYGTSQPTNTARWDNANSILHTQSPAQGNFTRSFLNLYDSQHIDTKNHRSGTMGSNSQNSEPSETQEPDLELRLSL